MLTKSCLQFSEYKVFHEKENVLRIVISTARPHQLGGGPSNVQEWCTFEAHCFIYNLVVVLQYGHPPGSVF